MAKPKLGSGARFKAVASSIANKEGYSEERAKAIAASIGRKKFGKTKMADLAKGGRKAKSKY